MGVCGANVVYVTDVNQQTPFCDKSILCICNWCLHCCFNL